MQRTPVALICSLLLLFCFGPISAERTNKCRYDKVAQVSQSTRPAGETTQKCSSGFYREQGGPNKGQCVPCSCNGLSNLCDPHTGNCENCQHNTTGDRCERCKEGYYGNAASRTCRACPCRKNFALACLDIDSGVIECLCKRGYSGTRCERCAFGYYGNPLEDGGGCKPCNCDNNNHRKMCNNRTGECIIPGNSIYKCDNCSITLQLELEKLRPVQCRLEQQLRHITNTPGSVLWLKPLEAKISDAQGLVENYRSAVKRLDTEVERAEEDVDVFRDDLSRLIDESFQGVIDGEKVSKNDTNLRAEVLLSGAEALLAQIQDVSRLQAEGKPSASGPLSGIEKATMMEEAQRIVDDLRKRSCSSQRLKAGREQEDAHIILDSLGVVTVGTDRAALNQTADSLMASGSSLEELTDLLSAAGDTVDRTKGLNLKNLAALHHLELERQNSSRLRPLTQMTKSLLKNVTNTYLMLEDVKKELESQAAQTDGARQELVKRLDTVRLENKVDVVTEAEEHAEGLLRAAMELQQALHSATIQRMGFSKIDINAVEEAERAANQSRETADRTLEKVKEEGLADKAEGLREKSAALWTEADETESDLESLSSTVNSHKDRVSMQRDKRQLLTAGVSALKDNIKAIQRDDIKILVESAKNATSASNSTVSIMTERLRNISQEVDKIEIRNWTPDILSDADQTVENLNRALPELHQKIAEVQDLSKRVPPAGNMAESIWRIKDVIEETRNYVTTPSLVTTFNGTSYVELHPPRDLEDLRAFTAVDLVLGRQPSKQRRRRDKRSHGSSFVLYLGSRNASGDYIGMALRNNVLLCTYKLSGTVHQVETSQLTISSGKALSFDRVVFRRVYQDADVSVTLNFISKEPLSLPPRRNLPGTTSSLLRLDPDSLVFYVGGYPENFTPPVELRYPGYSGAMKLSYINDIPVSLLNYKRINNFDAEKSVMRISRSKSSAYYQGTGYSMALVKWPNEKKRKLLRFQTNSRETNALLFYIGNEESFFCVFLERSLLVLQGREAGREFRLSSANKVSLSPQNQTISIGIQKDNFTVKYGGQQIYTHHKLTVYESYYIGGLPATLRQRHNITAPALRGCVDDLKDDAAGVTLNRTVGVTDGCPVSLREAVRSATLRSPLSADPLFARSDWPLRVSLGFRSSSSDGTVLRSSHQGLSSAHDFQLSLVDGFAVVKSDNYTLRTDTKCNDGRWHHLSAVRGPAGLELSVDNTRVTQSDHSGLQEKTKQEGEFTSCITNLYIRRPEDGVAPADLSLLTPPGDADFGPCRLSSPPISERRRVLPSHMFKTPQRHTPVEAPTGSQCKKRRVQGGEHHFPQGHSWVSYNVPQGDLNYRPHFALDINTKSSKGLIFHVGGSGAVPVLALYLANGKIKMTLGHNRIIQHKFRSNDGEWHRVEFSVEKSSFHLVVDRFRVTDGLLPNDEGSSLKLLNPVYLGGDPSSRNTKGHSVPTSSVIGCIRNFKMNEEVLWEAESSYGTLPCFRRLTRGTYFGGGYIFLEIDFSAGSQFDLAFELRPQRLTGLLFHYWNDRMSFVVFMRETEVVVEVDDVEGVVSVTVTPRETLCDGKFHLVKVSRENEELHLAVDSMSEKKAAPAASPSNSSGALYIGGTTKGNKATVSSPFVGCLRNVKFGGRPIELEEKSLVFGAVSINSCPAD